MDGNVVIAERVAAKLKALKIEVGPELSAKEVNLFETWQHTQHVYEEQLSPKDLNEIANAIVDYVRVKGSKVRFGRLPLPRGAASKEYLESDRVIIRQVSGFDMDQGVTVARWDVTCNVD